MAYINNINPDRFCIDYILTENFYDKDSVLISSNFLASLNEEQKMNLADMMGTSAVKNSEKKIEKLTRKGAFFDLPKTKGDFKKSKAYPITKQCISMLKPIMDKAKGKNTVEAVTAFQACDAAVSNLEKNIKYFERAFSTNDSANILCYLTIAAAVVEFTSIILINSTSITEENILIYRDPPKNSLIKNILYKNINKFNDICRNNKLKLNEELEAKVEEYNMIHHEAIGEIATIAGGVGTKLAGMGAAVSAGLAAHPVLAAGVGVGLIASSILALVYLTRTLICYFYFKKIQLSESLKYVSGMVEANGLAVSNGSPKDKKVGTKQSNLAVKLKKLGEALDNDNKQAQHNTVATLKKEDAQTSRTIEDKLSPDNRQEVTPRSDIDNLGDSLFI
jgi:hypothetical protein